MCLTYETETFAVCSKCAHYCDCAHCRCDGMLKWYITHYSGRFTELCWYGFIITVTITQYLKCISHIWLIPSLFNKVRICINTDPVYQIHVSLPNRRHESHFLFVTMAMRPAVLVPGERWSGQVECLWGLQVLVSWHFGTATEPASEPRSAGESSAAAHSHCEPRPCLQETNIGGVKMSKDRPFLSWSVPSLYCMYVWSFWH